MNSAYPPSTRLHHLARVKLITLKSLINLNLHLEICIFYCSNFQVVIFNCWFYSNIKNYNWLFFCFFKYILVFLQFHDNLITQFSFEMFFLETNLLYISGSRRECNFLLQSEFSKEIYLLGFLIKKIVFFAYGVLSE